jgi:manganese transport protein
LFGWPLPFGGVVIAVASLLLLMTRERGRWFEGAVVALLAVVLLAFLYQTLRAQAPLGDVASGLVPRFAGGESVLLGSGIIGATVMPHAMYLHSALTSSRRPDRDRETVPCAHRLDVLIAYGHRRGGERRGAGLGRGPVPRRFPWRGGAGDPPGRLLPVRRDRRVRRGRGLSRGAPRRRILVTVPALVVPALTHDPTRALVLS